MAPSGGGGGAVELREREMKRKQRRKRVDAAPPSKRGKKKHELESFSPYATIDADFPKSTPSTTSDTVS